MDFFFSFFVFLSSNGIMLPLVDIIVNDAGGGNVVSYVVDGGCDNGRD